MPLRTPQPRLNALDEITSANKSVGSYHIDAFTGDDLSYFCPACCLTVGYDNTQGSEPKPYYYGVKRCHSIPFFAVSWSRSVVTIVLHGPRLYATAITRWKGHAGAELLASTV
jgi:hypothetical protein